MNQTGRTLRHLGYGLYWMWTLLCFQSTMAFLPFGEGLAQILTSHSEFFAASLIATVLAHPLWALVLARVPAICGKTPWASAAITAASILVLGVMASPTSAFLIAVGVVSGMSSAMLDVRWLQVIGAMKPTESGKAVCASICVAVLGYMVLSLLGHVSPILCILVVTLLPLGSGAALKVCVDKGEGLLEPSQLQRAKHDAKQIAGSLTWPVAGSLAFFFVRGCLQSIISTRLDFNMLHITQLAFEFVAVLLLFIALTRNRKLETNRLYALVMALVCAGFLILPIAINSQTNAGLVVASILVNVGTTIIDVVILCSIAHAAYNWRASGAVVGGLTRGVTVGFMALGHLSGATMADNVWSGNVDFVIFVIVVTYLLILCCTLYISHIRGAKDVDATPGGEQEVATDEPQDEAAAAKAPTQAPAAQPSFDERIESIALAMHLSRREADVFSLIARGRSLPYAAEALSISENTVRSHVRRIYDKLGVHSKQELLDLVEHAQIEQPAQE